MYEHVGAAQLDAYAATIARLLRPGGLALNHGISRLYSDRPGRKAFVNRFVFPDGELPPLADVVAPLQRAGLEPRDVESLREHYTLTLRRWLAHLDEPRTAAVADIGGGAGPHLAPVHERGRAGLRRRRPQRLPGPGRAHRRAARVAAPAGANSRCSGTRCGPSWCRRSRPAARRGGSEGSSWAHRGVSRPW